MKRLLAAVAVMLSAGFTARAADAPQADIAHAIESLGGTIVRGPDGNIVEVSLARTGATDNDMERVVQLKGLKRLNLSFTYVTDVGIERLRELPQLEELTLDTTEALTDAVDRLFARE